MIDDDTLPSFCARFRSKGQYSTGNRSEKKTEQNVGCLFFLLFCRVHVFYDATKPVSKENGLMELMECLDVFLSEHEKASVTATVP